MENNEKRIAFCGIGEVQYKTFLNKDIMQMILGGKKYTPVHAVIMPTNVCNLNCSFCNCGRREENESLSEKEIIEILDVLSGYGVKAVTLSGGGEPTMHEGLKSIVFECQKRKMKVGLVTNGVKVVPLLGYDKDAFAWIRISCGDGRNLKQEISSLQTACELVRNGISHRVGVSYIVTEEFNENAFKEIVKYVCDHNELEYIKVLGDCFSSGVKINEELLAKNEKIIFAKPQPINYLGEKCFLPLVKPIFAADGYVYPCCDIQYHNGARDYEKSKSVCHYSAYQNFVEEQVGFLLHGVACEKCYHNSSNMFLQYGKTRIEDEDWI